MQKKYFVRVAALLAVGAASSVYAQEVATFRNGENGYEGTFDRRLGSSAGNNTIGPDVNTEVSSFFLDGDPRTGAANAVTDGLIRFDNIIGAGAIPANALIISASLDLRTTTHSNSQSGGGFNVYGLSSPFDRTTAWGAEPFGTDGTVGNTFRQGGYFSRPAAGQPTSARVDKIVQDWVNGVPNVGFAVRSDDTTDGWSFNTTGTPVVTNRPALTVSYTTDPRAKEVRYQQYINDYQGAYDLFPNGMSGSTSGLSVEGEFLSQGYLDGHGVNATTGEVNSYDQPYFLKFNDIDLSLPSITKAELIISTGRGGNSNTGGPWTVHRILKPWDENTTYESLDSDGNTAVTAKDELLANGFIAPESASVGLVPDAGIVTFDITDIAQAWKDGEANYGFYIGPGTADGWQIFTTGVGDSSLAPELRLLYAPASVPEPASLGLLAAGGLLMLRRRRKVR